MCPVWLSVPMSTMYPCIPPCAKCWYTFKTLSFLPALKNQDNLMPTPNYNGYYISFQRLIKCCCRALLALAAWKPLRLSRQSFTVTCQAWEVYLILSDMTVKSLNSLAVWYFYSAKDLKTLTSFHKMFQQLNIMSWLKTFTKNLSLDTW